MIKKVILFSLLFIGILNAANVTLNKATYTNNENIVVNFTDMTAKNQDWIGIYPKNSSNSWGNVVAWKWTNDTTEGQVTFDALPAGEYEARVFYNNSFTLEAKKAFLVEADAADAPTVTTDKTTYANDEEITVTFANMAAKNQDWIGIYPKDSSSAWANVVAWHWTDDTTNGQVTFDALPAGEYETRAFYNNSGHLEAKKAFTVTDAVEAPTVTTNKTTYFNNEQITVTFANMTAKNQDWIGIYPKDSSTAWANVVAWHWTDDTTNGQVTFDALPIGEYEARAFYNNSGHLEAKKTFTVTAVPEEDYIVKSDKDVYKSNELIRIYFKHFRGTASDWIGIFPSGADNQKESAVEWRDAKSLVKGELTFAGLPTGTYEARAYFATLHKETVQFTVEEQVDVTTLFEDAEDGIDPRWNRYAGNRPIQLLNVGAQGSAHSIRTIGYWENGSNPAGYYFPFGTPDKKMKFFDLDMRIGVSSHLFNFGVIVKTKNGNRRIIWASWMNHPGNNMSGLPPEQWRKPFHSSEGYMLMNPGPTDYYLATRYGQFTHYKINVEETLRILEPDNELISITGFTSSGGDYDNLSLKSR